MPVPISSFTCSLDRAGLESAASRSRGRAPSEEEPRMLRAKRAIFALSISERMFRRLATATIPMLVAGLSVAGPMHAAAAPAHVHFPSTVLTPNGSWLSYHHDDAHTGYDSS